MYRTAFVILASLSFAAIGDGAWDGDESGSSAQPGGTSTTEAISTRAVGGMGSPKFAPNVMRGDAGSLPLEDVSDRHFLIYLQL